MAEEQNFDPYADAVTEGGPSASAAEPVTAAALPTPQHQHSHEQRHWQQPRWRRA
mgnify:CR=1 FL=1